MVNFKSNITLTSTDAFLNPTLTFSSADAIEGNADYQTLTIPTNKSLVVYSSNVNSISTPQSTATVYFYAQAVNTNTSNLDIYIENSTNTSSSLVAILRPNDFMWVPLATYGSGLLKVTAVNLDGEKSSKVNVFWGEK
jgi:hypothetical protein